MVGCNKAPALAGVLFCAYCVRQLLRRMPASGAISASQGLQWCMFACLPVPEQGVYP